MRAAFSSVLDEKSGEQKREASISFVVLYVVTLVVLERCFFRNLSDYDILCKWLGTCHRYYNGKF